MNLAVELRDLSVHISAIVRLVSAKYKLSLSQSNILHSIPSDVISLVSLSNRIGLDVSTMSRNIVKLANKNLVQKQKSSSDLREYNIIITELGVDLLKNINADLAEFIDSISDLHLYSDINDSIEKINWLFLKLRDNS